GKVHGVHASDVTRRLLQTGGAFPVQRRETSGSRVGQREPGVLHAERIEQPLLEESIEGLTGYHLDHAAEHVHARAGAVAPPRAGLEIERNGGEPRDVVGERLGRLARREPGGGLAGTATEQPRRVREKVANRDLPSGRNDPEGLMLVAGAVARRGGR